MRSRRLRVGGKPRGTVLTTFASIVTTRNQLIPLRCLVEGTSAYALRG